MDEQVETIVIGAGQAGLAMSWHLSQRGCDHLVVERARIAFRVAQHQLRIGVPCLHRRPLYAGWPGRHSLERSPTPRGVLCVRKNRLREWSTARDAGLRKKFFASNSLIYME